MNIVTQDSQLAENFYAVSEHLANTDPNDFDSQVTPYLVTCNALDRTLVCRFNSKPFFGNPHGYMHGGIIAAMVDTAGGTTIHAFCGGQTHIVTISLQISYIRPVLVEKPLFVRVHVQQIGGRVAYTSAEAWQEEGKIVSTCSGVYHVIHGVGPDISQK